MLITKLYRKANITLGPLFGLFMALNLSPMSQMFGVLDKFLDRTKVPNLSDGENFDFIIVGGGSSGSTLAAHLSENYRVLLLEAGGISSPANSIPIFSHLMNRVASIDWKYNTVPQKHAAFALNDNEVFWGAGKGLGGSSLVNAAIYLRENTQGFDTVAEETGDPIWRLENILKYYKKMEDYKGFFDQENHGRGGEVSIEPAHNSPLIDNFLRAGQELGYPVRDPNRYGPLIEGFSPMDFYQKYGRKLDAYKGSVFPILGRANLVIRKYSFVRHLLMNGTRAYGVEYERHGSILNVHATKEVILCAGTMQNPKLLMLAGIGPKEHLNELGIPLRIDLPVGKILEDKYGAMIGPFTVDDGNGFRIERDVTISVLLRWLFLGRGTVATGRSEASYQILSDFAKSEGRLAAPDLHTYILVLGAGSIADRGMGGLNFNKEFFEYIDTVRDRDAFFQVVTVSKPFSHGTLRLVDKNPNSYPIIDPNYLGDERDLRALTEGLKFAVKLVEETSAFKEINAKLIDVPFPGCKEFPFKSHLYFECLGRHTTATAYKYSGTTPIGKDRTDPFAVVDSRFRVLGTEGLRVVGGSMLRVSTVSVNDITCRMLGVLASDVIKMEYDPNYLIESLIS